MGMGLVRGGGALAVVTAQLETLLLTGGDLAGGLLAVIESRPPWVLRRVYRRLFDDIENGHDLSAAMRRQHFFPAYYCDLVEAGERQGELEQTFRELRGIVDQSESFMRGTARWLAYVGLQLYIQLIVLGFLVVKVLPVMAEIMAEFSAQTALFQRFSAAGAFVESNIAEAHLFLVFVFLASLPVAAYLIWREFRHGAPFLSSMLARLPVIRRTVLKRDVAHVCLVLEKLLRAEVPLHEALEDVSKLAVTDVAARMLRRLSGRTEQGMTLHEAWRFETGPLAPRALLHFVAVGEQSGTLPEALGRMGRHYLREAVKTERVVMSAVEPLQLAAPAILVAVVALGFFQMIESVILSMLAQL